MSFYFYTTTTIILFCCFSCWYFSPTISPVNYDIHYFRFMGQNTKNLVSKDGNTLSICSDVTHKQNLGHTHCAGGSQTLQQLACLCAGSRISLPSQARNWSGATGIWCSVWSMRYSLVQERRSSEEGSCAWDIDQKIKERDVLALSE